VRSFAALEREATSVALRNIAASALLVLPPRGAGARAAARISAPTTRRMCLRWRSEP